MAKQKILSAARDAMLEGGPGTEDLGVTFGTTHGGVGNGILSGGSASGQATLLGEAGNDLFNVTVAGSEAYGAERNRFITLSDTAKLFEGDDDDTVRNGPSAMGDGASVTVFSPLTTVFTMMKAFRSQPPAKDKIRSMSKCASHFTEMERSRIAWS
ncbi:MAG: hypothetical protein AAFY25_13540 [Pseudomonadota bacterium]